MRKLMRCFGGSRKWFFRICCAIVLFVSAAASVSGYYERWPFWTTAIAEGSTEPYEILMLKGTLERPYVYRHLLPDLANFAERVTPRKRQDALFESVFPSTRARGGPKFGALADAPESVRRAWFFPALILYLLTFVSAALAVTAMYLVCKTIGMPLPVCVVAPMITILLAPYFYIYPYDYSELAFLMAATWIALRFEWWWLLPVAALGAWNKESFFFFVPSLYPFLRQRASARIAATGVAILTSVCGLVYIYTRARFANSPGTPVEFALWDRLSSFFDPFLLFTSTDEVYGFRFLRVSTLFPTLFLILVMARTWTQMPGMVRLHGTIAAAINFPLYVLFCSPNEYRNFSLLSVVFVLAIAFNLKEWLERSALNGSGSRGANP
jgi:hypothetical protein